MSIQVQEHGSGTSIRVSYPWGVYLGGRAMCEDGVIRTLKRIAQTADTFFSVPASVTVRGKTVAGYVTMRDGVVYFHVYRYRRNWTAFGLKEGD